MMYPVMNLAPRMGQAPARKSARELTEEYCRNAEQYAEMAKEDPDFSDTAEYYRDLCDEARRSVQLAREEAAGPSLLPIILGAALAGGIVTALVLS